MSTDTMHRFTAPAGHGRLTRTRVLHSEWVKLRTLRSTFFTLLAAAVAMTGMGPLFSALTASHWSEMSVAERASVNPTALSLIGFFLAQLAVGVMGVLVVSGEYSTGMIRATFSAVPRRLPVLWAKATVYAAVTWGLMTAMSLTAFLAGQALMSSTGAGASLSDPGVTRAVLGTGLYLTVVGLLSVAVGTLTRNTAGGITAVFGLLLVLPELVKALPSSWSDRIGPYLPSNAGHALAVLQSDPHTLAPWTGFTVFCLYAAVALGGAAVALKRRDA
ncbi:ABC transporter permease [Streptomyces sp. NBC_01237]|uniref:ABC transporter permease n=1 Tax=Streptomyces sp. NBC_01237 TaxID=2903790 RepID=UPI002DD9CA48|nr:ABC transporter permease [Streptomyces sp. NBC_01237]